MTSGPRICLRAKQGQPCQTILLCASLTAQQASEVSSEKLPAGVFDTAGRAAGTIVTGF